MAPMNLESAARHSDPKVVVPNHLLGQPTMLAAVAVRKSSEVEAESALVSDQIQAVQLMLLPN